MAANNIKCFPPASAWDVTRRFERYINHSHVTKSLWLHEKAGKTTEGNEAAREWKQLGNEGTRGRWKRSREETKKRVSAVEKK